MTRLLISAVGLSIAVAAVVAIGCDQGRAPPRTTELGRAGSKRAPTSHGICKPAYEVLDEKDSETPGKTQVELHILLKDRVDEASVRGLLSCLHVELSKLSGFRFHLHPTSIWIYAYLSRTDYGAGALGWVGMSGWNALGSNDGADPRVEVKVKAIASVQSPTSRSGLSEERRRQIFRELVGIEHRATADADKALPIDGSARDVRERVSKNIDLMRELKERYRKEYFAEHHLSEADADAIALEGTEKNWPLPSPGR